MKHQRITIAAAFSLSLIVTGMFTASGCHAQTNSPPKNSVIPDPSITDSTRSADEDINIKLKELMSHPNSNMRTFDALDEGTSSTRIKPPETGTSATSIAAPVESPGRLTIPLSATVGSDIDLRVLKANSFSNRFKALSVRVENRTDKTLVIDGDRASLVANSGQNSTLACASQNAIDAVGKPPSTAKAKISSDFKATIAAALTVGAVPTAETIITEHGPIKKRYEWDEQRREREDSRFGKRMLYPGDKTDGLIFFDSTITLNKKLLSIPVTSFYDGAAQTVLQKVIEVDD